MGHSTWSAANSRRSPSIGLNWKNAVNTQFGTLTGHSVKGKGGSAAKRSFVRPTGGNAQHSKPDGVNESRKGAFPT